MEGYNVQCSTLAETYFANSRVPEKHPSPPFFQVAGTSMLFAGPKAGGVMKVGNTIALLQLNIKFLHAAIKKNILAAIKRNLQCDKVGFDNLLKMA